MTLYDILLCMGLNRGIVSSPFQDWEFVLQDKIPATVGLMHNILQSVKIANSPLPSHLDVTLHS